jgi:thiol-disulfide isomerase/thioredoxin
LAASIDGIAKASAGLTGDGKWLVERRGNHARNIVIAQPARSESRRHSSMNTNKLLVAAVLAIAIGAPIAGFMGDMNGQSMTSPGVRVPFLHGLPTGQIARQSELASLERASEWLNSPPLAAPALRGKVVLIDFWTYTCINWLRTLPYVRAWDEKYRNQGLVVIGIHAPEFAFEKDLNNVRRAVKDMRIDYPITVDNDHVIWRAFNNQYWPALYFIDAQGRVRHHHFGEGAYEQSEMIIQELLAEAGVAGVSREPASVDARGIEATADWSNLKSPENYVGHERTQNFTSPGGAVLDQPRAYVFPARLRLNDWALSGDWTVQNQAAVLNKPNGRIAYRFHARDLHLVMGPPAPGTPVRFRVLIDGRPPGAAHGIDVDEQGEGTVTEQRLYQLIRQPKPIADRQFEIEFLGPGVQAFAFTFG